MPAPIPDRLALLPTLPLHSGSHGTFDEGHCAMELVAWLAGEPHSDSPACASPVITAFVRSWNDGLPSDEDRARILGPLLPRVVGSVGSAAVEEQRAYMALDWLIRVHAPAWLDLVESCRPHAAALRALAPIVDVATAHAGDTVDAAGAAAWDAAGAAARAAAGAAGGDAAGDALRPTVEALQVSAAELLDRMLSIGDVATRKESDE